MGIFRLGKRFGWCNPRRVSESQKPRPLEIRGQECLFVMKQSTGRRCFGFFELVWNAWRVPHSALETSQRNSSSFFPQDIGWRYQDSEGLEVAISSDSDSRTAMLESWPSHCCQDIMEPVQTSPVSLWTDSTTSVSDERPFFLALLQLYLASISSWFRSLATIRIPKPLQIFKHERYQTQGSK